MKQASHCDNCTLCQHKLCARRVPIFQELNQDELNHVVQLIIRKKYSKGEMIVFEDGLLDSLMIINRGQVKAFRDTQEGKEQILYIFSEGDFFGEKNLLITQKASYHVEALEETLICMIQSRDFLKLLKEYPEISLKIVEQLSHRIDRLEQMIRNMGTKNIEARVSAVLLEFAMKYGKEQSEGVLIELPLSREGIANYIGVARETVSRKLSILQEEGIINMIGNKKVVILDKKALENEVE
ncbi:MAG: transcriptional regulator, Crp/Fnr family [Herbinix sp.]|nr:transcriptional regulator, Crp/Fnr family [Herbinix sp.]